MSLVAAALGPALSLPFVHIRPSIDTGLVLGLEHRVEGWYRTLGLQGWYAKVVCKGGITLRQMYRTQRIVIYLR